MSGKRGAGGGDKVGNLTVEILKQIRGELGSLRGELGSLRGDVGSLRDEMHQTNVRLEALEHATVAGFQHLSGRIDALGDRFEHLRDFSGDRYRGHERRIERLERKVFSRRVG